MIQLTLRTVITSCYLLDALPANLSHVLQDHAGSSWRVGVHAPAAAKTAKTTVTQAASTTDHTSSQAGAADSSGKRLFLDVLRNKQRVHAAIMHIELLDANADNDDVLGAADSVGVVNVHLWCTEGVSSVLEVNKSLIVTKADSMAGLMFGMPAKALVKQPLTRSVAQTFRKLLKP